MASFAFISGAFAEVTISGVAEAAIKSTGGTKTIIGGTNGTEISFGVSEDLGNGLKAIASSTFCSNIADGMKTAPCGNSIAGTSGGNVSSPSAAAAVNTYNSYVGLTSADFGSVKIGQQFSNTFWAAVTGDVGGMSGLSNFAAMAGAGAGQVANSLTYNSPTFAGFGVNYQQTLDNAASTVSDTNYSLTYTNGGLNAAIASSKVGSNAAETVIGANYNFGVATIYGVSKTQSGLATSTGYGVAVPVGALTLSASVTKGSVSGTVVNSTGFGGAYNLSKRTSVYAAQATTDGAATATYVGVRHNF